MKINGLRVCISFSNNYDRSSIQMGEILTVLFDIEDHIRDIQVLWWFFVEMVFNNFITAILYWGAEDILLIIKDIINQTFEINR